MNNSYTYSTPSTSLFDWGTITAPIAIMLIVGFCIILINIIVFIKFVIMMDDVRTIRNLLEDKVLKEPKITIDKNKDE